MISAANRALLERRFGKKLPAGDPKVTLTVSGIAALLDSAREEGCAAAINILSRKNTPAENVEAILKRMSEIVDGKKP